MKHSVITDDVSQDVEHALDVMLGCNVLGAELWNSGRSTSAIFRMIG
jgi:hypothetical protein